MPKITQVLASFVLAMLPWATGADLAKITVPGGPGGGYDAAARVPIQVMQETGILVDDVQVANKVGVGGTSGLDEFIHKNKYDDYALMSMGSTLMGGILMRKSSISLDQVVPLVRLTDDADVLVVSMDSPIKTVADVVNALKTKPRTLAIGGGSLGGVDQVLAGLIAKSAGVDPRKLNYIPYSSSSQLVPFLTNGQLTLALSGWSELKPYIDQHRLRIVAVTSANRLPGVDAPTLKESGVDVVIGNWRGIVGAPGMSDSGRAMWLDHFQKMYDSPAWKQTLARQGWMDAYLSGDDFTQFLSEEKVRQAQVLKDLGLTR